MKKWIVGVLGLALALSLSTAALAGRGHGRGHYGSTGEGQPRARVERQADDQRTCPYNDDCPYPESGGCSTYGACRYADGSSSGGRGHSGHGGCRRR